MHLFTRGTTYYYRRRLPKFAIDLTNIHELKFALKTSDKFRAKYLCSRINYYLDQIILFYTEGKMNNDKFIKAIIELQRLASYHIIGRNKGDIQQSTRQTRDKILSNDISLIYFAHIIQAYSPDEAKEFHDLFFDKIQIEIYDLNCTFDARDEPYKQILLDMWKYLNLLSKNIEFPDDYPRTLAEEQRNILNQHYKDIEGTQEPIESNNDFDMERRIQENNQKNIKTSEELLLRTLNLGEPTTQIQSSDDKVPRLSEMIHKRLLESKAQWQPGTYSDYSASLDHLLYCLGDDPFINQIDRTDLTSAAKNLDYFPSNIRDYKIKYSTFTALKHYIITNEKKMNIKMMADDTKKKHCLRWSGLWDWMVTNTIYINKNVAKDLYKVKKESKSQSRASNKRREITPEEMMATLIAINWDTIPVSGKKNKLKFKTIKTWIILIAIYTGARINEICQLYCDNIVKDEKTSIWYFDFTDEREDQKIKSDAGIRKYPIHKDLIDLGLLDYRNKIINDKGLKTLMWPGLIHNHIDGYGGQISSSINILIDKYISEDPKLTLHSFRHSLVNELKNKVTNKDLRLELQGHSKGSGESEKTYEKDYWLTMKKDAIDLVDYGLDFSKIKISLDYTR